MSVVASRAAIVAALELAGMAATPAAPAPIVAGNAWPVLASATPINYCVDEATWYVFVAVPGSTNAASVATGDVVIDALLPAFKTVGKVTAVEPWSWPVEPGSAAVPVIRFTLEA